MPGLSRKGDKNTTGGAIQLGADTVFCNNIAVGLHGPSELTPHDPSSDSSHKQAKTTEGSPSVFAEGKPVLRIGSANTCGHKIKDGSEDVFVE
jgi:uncharacterized Zn-binding protein involved in type VI secretion